ncbi:MAG: hypothetical protein ACLGHQ_01050 [Acidimicrobiia bacterium]
MVQVAGLALRIAAGPPPAVHVDQGGEVGAVVVGAHQVERQPGGPAQSVQLHHPAGRGDRPTDQTREPWRRMHLAVDETAQMVGADPAADDHHDQQHRRRREQTGPDPAAPVPPAAERDAEREDTGVQQQPERGELRHDHRREPRRRVAPGRVADRSHCDPAAHAADQSSEQQEHGSDPRHRVMVARR